MDNSARLTPEGDEDIGEMVAMVLRHITAVPTGTALLTPPLERLMVQDTALDWQGLGAYAEWAEFHGAMRGAVEGRMSELIGRAAVTGEQLGLAWTLDQELQRWEVLPEARYHSGRSMSTRALAEMCGYYVLAAAHGLGNLSLRTLAISSAATALLATRYSDAEGFRPFSQKRAAWLPLSPRLAETARTAAVATGGQAAIQLIQVVSDLLTDPRWMALVDRRDTDYHRWRPQGLPNGGVPQKSMWDRTTPGTRSLSGGTLFYDPVDHEALCGIAGDALEVVAKAMRTWLEVWPAALSELGVPVFKTVAD